MFKGNLSLVGPRPHAVNASAANRRYDDAVDVARMLKPGQDSYSAADVVDTLLAELPVASA